MKLKLVLRIVAGIICSPLLLMVFILVGLPFYAITGEWFWR